MLRGAVVGADDIMISHLQFADDTIVFIEPSMEYLLSIKRILSCFEIVSGLRINFHKSCIVRGSKKVPLEENWDQAFRCRKASLPITYLGLQLGENPGSKSFWDLVIHKIEQRLAPWKRKVMSKGGRLILIKAVSSLFELETESAKCMEEGFRVIIGRGDRASFWKDIKWDSIALNEAFPRIFAISTKKSGIVSEFGTWQGHKWESKSH
ncbi:hypothetical protein Dsin_006043 [Dipteronia sinensis]|uniref:Reverse transcriptase domain-containing protein n=1 Tax=Dipteronia sinensis TaxID=43782 RepID=A0AAE0AXN5_9ROSI|nr:hypothetical protein Dsin_006043 [Dipteronia sinensis]